MAITTVNLTTAASSTDASSYTTASITPGANRLILAWVEHVRSPLGNTPTLSGNGLTWVFVASVDFTSTRRLNLFRAMGSSPSAGTVTIDFAGQSQLNCLWSIIEFDGVDTGGTHGSAAVVQAVTNSAVGGTSFTVTLGAFSSTQNATAGGFADDDNTIGISPGSGFTELGEVTADSNGHLQSEWRVENDTSVDVSKTTAPPNWGGIAVEIRASDPGIIPLVRRSTPHILTAAYSDFVSDYEDALN